MAHFVPHGLLFINLTVDVTLSTDTGLSSSQLVYALPFCTAVIFNDLQPSRNVNLEILKILRTPANVLLERVKKWYSCG